MQESCVEARLVAMRDAMVDASAEREQVSELKAGEVCGMVNQSESK
jgi:hypothetical protein